MTGAILGSPDAPVTIVEFTDYECPFCRRWHQETFPVLLEEFIQTGKVRFVLRDLPLPFHPDAIPAARAARCVREQDEDAYWLFVEAAMKGEPALDAENLANLAGSTGVDRPTFDGCLKSDRHDDFINADAQDAKNAGLGGTPAFVLGPTKEGEVRGLVISGAYPIETFRSAIEEALGD